MISKKLEGFIEEQWEKHDSPIDSKQTVVVISVAMEMKLATIESLLKFRDVLDSSKCLTDKEDHIKRINGNIIAFTFPCLH